ncbi:hypothetical protein [Psychroserpens sp. Hel_I_66]|uniref:hypothetical protein n=1 Tax=Psychroserpens sp. Hel_I_66 TaxID=1250004 RepID=UPI0006461E1F|nr:hypothetical protein [Psychroserpens sp. Hel_I_66]
MNVNKILEVILILLCILFVGLQSQTLEIEASGIRALAMLLLTALYILKVEKKHIFFMLFLFTFIIADFFNFITWVENFDIDPNFDYFYYIGNSLYILAYLFLIFRVLDAVNLIRVISKFPLQTILLSGLGVFVAYIVTDITKHELSNSEFIMELSYNAVVVFLMCLSMINYMYKEDKKSMNLLIGSICIVFSEILQLAYYYISETNSMLNILCSLFFIIAFIFLYLQSITKSKFVQAEEPINLE